ncbi:DUF1240 domain-containing protein [Xenorhabdus szentirmaii]|uniref:DUF1240 domain-containing protein n=1 Tax=Xenorhabdus szentirmaii TaxID=290112 RepID=UPI0019831931|nr:DUF1240 domain-containing protein [Xenorhabdus sp. 38]
MYCDNISLIVSIDNRVIFKSIQFFDLDLRIEFAEFVGSFLFSWYVHFKLMSAGYVSCEGEGTLSLSL